VKKIILIAGIVLLLALVGVVAWSINQTNQQRESKNNTQQTQQQATGKGGLTQTDKQGAVEVALTWLNPGRNETSLKMDVSMNTHSVDLNSYNLVQNVEVYADNRQITSQFGLNTQGEGHHVQNVLTVPDVNLRQAKTLKVILKNLDNIPSRTFIWDLLQVNIK